MLRRTALIVATVLTAVVGAAHGAVFVNPIVALPGFPLSCSQLVDSGQRLPAVAGSATGRAVVAALAPNCSVAAALRSTGNSFGAPQTIGGQLAAGTDALDVPKPLVNARGDAVVAWSTEGGCALAFAPAGSDTFGLSEPPTILDGARCAIAIDGTGRVVVTRDGGLVDRNPGGGYGPPATPFATGARVIALADNERGDAVALAESDAGPGLRRLDVSVRPAGGVWGAPAALATRTAYRPFVTARDVSLAIDATGDILIVWPDGVSSGPLPSIGPTGTLMYATGTLAAIGSPKPVPAPGTAVLESRRGYVFVMNARGDATIIFAAVTGALSGAFVLSDRPAGALEFGPAQTIGTVQTSKLAGAFTKFAAGAVPLAGALAADGTLVIAQGIDDVGVSFLQARVRPPGAGLGRPVWLSAPGTGALIRSPTEVAASAGADGSALIAWRGFGPRRAAGAIVVTPAALDPTAVTGGPPPVTFRVVKVVATRRFLGTKYIPRLLVTFRASRATTAQVTAQGRTDVVAIGRAGVSTVEDGCFSACRRHVRPGQRIRLVIDAAGAGKAKVVRTITLPR